MDPSWLPPLPDFAPPDEKARWSLFGKFAYQDEPSGDGVKITDGWDKQNIVTVWIPQLKGIPHGWGKAKCDGKIPFNKKAQSQLQSLFAHWERAGVLTTITADWKVGRTLLTFDGSFNPRYMRKAKHIPQNLSNHAWGTAFDINAKWNPLGGPAAKLGQKGCVRELVEIANEHGFYWGGHYKDRPDGMHFEVAKLF